jgi:hypothetical protein
MEQQRKGIIMNTLTAMKRLETQRAHQRAEAIAMAMKQAEKRIKDEEKKKGKTK